MNVQDHDKVCNELFRKLDMLKTQGQGGKIASAEYLETLKALQVATRARLADAGIIQVDA